MRVLFAGAPSAGHLFPLVPLAKAARARGHEVLIGSLDGGEVVAGAGLPFVNVAPGVDWRVELRRRAALECPELLARTLETNSADREAYVPLAALVNETVADSFVDLALRWRADVIVYEYLFPVGLVAATRLGVPALQHDLGFARTANLRRLMLNQLSPAMDRHGISGRPAPAATLDLAPPSMAPAQDGGWPLRPVAYNGRGTLPGWLARRPEGRPRIAVTLGTVPPKVDGLTRIDRVVTAAAQVDVELVLVMGEIDISPLGELPDNVRGVGWVPWDAVLAVSDAAVHHGGGGTTLAALAAGVPQLVLPDGSDRFVNAEAVRDRGAGCAATAEETDADLLRRLLTDEKIAVAAAEVAAEIASMPAPEAIISRIEDLSS